DAAAITLALASPELDLLGVTTVMGNLPLEQTYRNTRDVLAHFQVSVPAIKGNSDPLIRNRWVGSELDRGRFFPDENLSYPEEVDVDAVTWLKESLERSEEIVILVPLAPMTNIAKLMTFYPELVHEKVDRIVCMGGGYKFGNSTGVAELNIYADPEAAQVVFSFGIPVVMCGLDVCHNAYITKEDYISLLKPIDNKAGQFISRICEESFSFEEREDIPERFKLWKRPGAIIYDTVPIIYLLHPEIFDTVKAAISVECESEYCDGMTICNTSPWSNVEKIHTLVLDLDREAYLSAVREVLISSEL
ncbi:MAG: nucleoside hydrolase, partial [Oscillospiraceae bacterium]|nr:nucleoside hydrolase [Oscillospiraceae bacterium]